MKIAIVGASGHIGNNLARIALAHGHTVKALCPDATTAKSLKDLTIEKFDIDILKATKLTEIFHDCDAVFNLAGMISIKPDKNRKVHELNVTGASNCAKAAYEAGVKKFIHLSSIHAYTRFPLHEYLNENRTLAIGNDEFDYDRSKALSEQAVLNYQQKGLDATILQPTGIIGLNQWDLKAGSPMSAVLLKAFKTPIHITTGGGFNWVDVRDVCETALRAISLGKNGESYILGGHWLSNQELFKLIRPISNKKRAPIIKLPIFMLHLLGYLNRDFSTWFNYTPSFTNYSIVSIQSYRYIDMQKATTELGHRPRPIDQTLRDLHAWFREQKLL